jgi:hypothetical protein
VLADLPLLLRLPKAKRRRGNSEDLLMWVEAILTKDDLATLLVELCPLTLALDQASGRRGCSRWRCRFAGYGGLRRIWRNAPPPTLTAMQA